MVGDISGEVWLFSFFFSCWVSVGSNFVNDDGFSPCEKNEDIRFISLFGLPYLQNLIPKFTNVLMPTQTRTKGNCN